MHNLCITWVTYSFRVSFTQYITTTMNTRLAIHLLQCIIWAYGLQGISTICQYMYAMLAYLLYLCKVYPIKYPHGFVVVIVSVLGGFMQFIYPYLSEMLHWNWLTHHFLNQLWQISVIWNQSIAHIKSKLAIFLWRKLSSNAILERTPHLLMILLINSSPPSAAYMRQWIESPLFIGFK